MNSITFSSQSTFIKGMNLVDGVVVVNEIVDFTKKTKNQCMILIVKQKLYIISQIMSLHQYHTKINLIPT